MGAIKIPYLVPKPSGYYWQPTPAIKALGFRNQPLGTDPVKAAQEAQNWNLKVAAAKAAKLAKQAGATADTVVVIGTYADLVDVYRGNEERGLKPSREWRNLKPSSRQNYTVYINRILGMWGDMPVADTTPEAVEAVRDSLEDQPRTANGLLSVLRAMLNVAAARPSRFGLTYNPAAKVPLYGQKDGVVPRQVFWEDKQETAFLKAARKLDWEMYVAYHLLVYTGQRPGDVQMMTVADYDGEKISLCQSKTAVRLWIPVHSDLKAVLDEHLAMRRAEGRIGGTILQRASGKAFTYDSFDRRWKAVIEAAGLKDLQRRDLRRTAVIRLAEAGCTVPEIAAITGHSIKSVEDILRTYLVRTYPQAQAAIRKLEEYRSRTKLGTRV
jgi:integrase